MTRLFSIIVAVVVVAAQIGGSAGDSYHRSIGKRDVSGSAAQKVDWNAMAQETLRQKLSSKPNENVARNVIMFLGDGMGISTVTTGRIYCGQRKGQTGEEYQLAFDKFPYVALAKTYNTNSQVPDSAGTGTAFLSGIKANIGTLGVSQDARRGVCSTTPNNSVDSIVRWSINEGKRTGIVTTTRITHATPAAGYAHVVDRDWEADVNIPESYRYDPSCPDIATQLVTSNSDINVLMGGGSRFFLPANGSSPNQGIRLDGRNLIEEWKSKLRGKSAVYASNKTQFDAVDTDNTDYLFGLFNRDHLQFRASMTDPTREPTLAEMTEKAIKILRRGPNGYFLLVEGGRIDHAHHLLLAKVAMEEMLEFNEAVEKAISMVNLSDTLVVVTSDHSHTLSMGGYPTRGNPILGIIDPDGFKQEPSTDGMPYLTMMYANGPGGNRTNLTGVDVESSSYVRPSAVPLLSETHAGEDVAVFATGPMAHLFRGVVEQSYVPHVMAYASCVGMNKAHCSYASSTISPTTLKSAASGHMMPGSVNGCWNLKLSCIFVIMCIYRLFPSVICVFPF